MIRFYEGSGSKEIELLGRCFTVEDWSRLKGVAIRLLERRGHAHASEFLRAHAFDLHHGTNGFCDEFCLLYMKVPLDDYVRMAEQAEDSQLRFDCLQIVEAIGEVGYHVRFIAVELDPDDGPRPVSPPVLEITSDTVERALRDAERLMASAGATSGTDRVHTAFHGYLRAVASKAGLPHSDNASVTELFRVLREHHPSFQQARVLRSDIDKILRSLANVVDTLNPVRNHASVAHPNPALLEEPEAMLVINSVRSLLHYVNARTRP